jgi:endonuclease YncB( thermonuclease family)
MGLSFRALVLLTSVTLPAGAQTVTDGDTIKLDGTTWRLWGIDAPETR